MDNLLNLVIYSLSDGEIIDRLSVVHLTDISLDGELLTVKSAQHSSPLRYLREKVGFYFESRQY